MEVRVEGGEELSLSRLRGRGCEDEPVKLGDAAARALAGARVVMVQDSDHLTTRDSHWQTGDHCTRFTCTQRPFVISGSGVVAAVLARLLLTGSRCCPVLFDPYCLVPSGAVQCLDQ